MEYGPWHSMGFQLGHCALLNLNFLALRLAILKASGGCVETMKNGV